MGSLFRHSESCDSKTMANNEKWTLHHLVVFSLTFFRWVHLIQCSLHIQKIVYLKPQTTSLETKEFIVRLQFSRDTKLGFENITPTP